MKDFLGAGYILVSDLSGGCMVFTLELFVTMVSYTYLFYALFFLFVL